MKNQYVCSDCIGVDSPYIQKEILNGSEETCDYCGDGSPCMDVDVLADIVLAALKNHYIITPTEPEPWISAMLNDKEYEGDGWYREGMDIQDTIKDLLSCDEALGDDIAAIIMDGNLYEVNGYDQYDVDPLFEYSINSDPEWDSKWKYLEYSIKNKSRFFNSEVKETLDEIFEGLEALNTNTGSPVLIKAGPEGNDLRSLFRARVHSSIESLKRTLSSPERELGPPPAEVASAGRMNARGISVFYGAFKERTAIAEVRPHVGSYVVVGRFDFIEPVKLVDLPALREVVNTSTDLLDPKTYNLEQQLRFLEELSRKISKPIHPHEIELEYITTQVVAEYLGSRFDGLIFNSAQKSDKELNVVLFHHASLVKQLVQQEGESVNVHFQNYLDLDRFSPTVTTWVDKLEDKNSHQFYKNTVTEEDWNDDSLLDDRQPCLSLDRQSVFVSQIRGIDYLYESEKVSFATYDKPTEF
ncbi:RES domain-containing protein [Vibrio diazotrophicus]|uniref:RES domain-containing protein n=1 Tax=Vibrio diazotrophicus TaxID=685 RepID=UPI00142D383A|nr:RES domain-containing protein [Vibrio diazotrophicus]NIY92584.1 RES family NAD+ phosphorylase [Vibrio diazotrophicus]